MFGERIGWVKGAEDDPYRIIEYFEFHDEDTSWGVVRTNTSRDILVFTPITYRKDKIDDKDGEGLSIVTLNNSVTVEEPSVLDIQEALLKAHTIWMNSPIKKVIHFIDWEAG